MKRLALIVGLLALQLYPVAAFWQSRDSNYNTVISAASPPVPSYVATATGSHTGSVQSATMSIGNPAYIATRRVMLVVTGACGGNSIVSGSGTTINGVNATIDVQIEAGSGGGACCAELSAVVTSGTTSVPIQVTYSGTTGDAAFGTFTVDNSTLQSTTPSVGSASNGTGASPITSSSFTGTSSGFMVGGLTFIGGSSQAFSTAGWSTNGSSFGEIVGSNFSPSAGSQTVAGTSGGSPTGAAICAAAWH